MKKAALVLATSVAFFFGAMNAEAGKKMVSMPSAQRSFQRDAGNGSNRD